MLKFEIRNYIELLFGLILRSKPVLQEAKFTVKNGSGDQKDSSDKACASTRSTYRYSDSINGSFASIHVFTVIDLRVIFSVPRSICFGAGSQRTFQHQNTQRNKNHNKKKTKKNDKKEPAGKDSSALAAGDSVSVEELRAELT